MGDIRNSHIAITGVDITLRRLTAIGGGAPKYMGQVLQRAMELDMLPAWTRQINLQDHSLEDLKRLGHPYSVRFGTDSFVHPDAEVHEQSGNLLYGTQILTGNTGLSVQMVNTAPEYVYLRYGTATMRIRDPGSAALKDALPAIKARFSLEVHGAIINVFETYR